jgi:uncharacterized protein involved in cysteine biosynthesis
MLIVADFLSALGQMGDPRFRSVLLRGVGLTVALLLALYVLTVMVVSWIFPETITLPFVGQVGFLDKIASGASLLAVMALSVFLMVPVASAFTGLFLDEVAEAVEDRHYPRLTPVRPAPFLDGVRDAARFFGVVVVANLLALILYAAFPPFSPLIFWGMNGYLLGREYFQMAAMRRMPMAEAKALRRKHALSIWAAGCLMAVPLTIPLVNLAIPILGAATFTHIYHRFTGGQRR